MIIKLRVILRLLPHPIMLFNGTVAVEWNKLFTEIKTNTVVFRLQLEPKECK